MKNKIYYLHKFVIWVLKDLNEKFLNQNINQKKQQTLDWQLIQEDFKTKFGNDVFESWLKKMDLLEVNLDYLLISVPTRFIRDWITSRYLDNVKFK